MNVKIMLRLALTTTITIGLAGCGGDTGGGGGDDGPLKGVTLVVGGKDFSEQDILANMTADLLAKNGAGAEVKRITGSENTRKALEGGDINIYWEYTGTAWITYLKNTEPIGDPQQQYDAVKKADEEKNGVAWLSHAEFNNTYALAVRTEYANEKGLKSLSDLATLSASDPAAASICVESEFAARDDGLTGLLAAYGIKAPKNQIKTLDTGVIYAETDKGSTCNFGEVFATDGRIVNLGLTVLADDKKFFPVYQGAPTLKAETLQKNPQIAEILKPLSDKLDTETMQKLNAQVDVDGLDADDVAEKWLKDQGLL